MTQDLMHEPTPQFRDFLEGEVIRTYRRDRTWRRLRGLAVVVSSLAIGLSAGLASAQMGEGAQRDSLLQTARTDLQLAGLRLELARAQLADVTAKVKAGALGTASLASAESELRRMEALAMRAKLNVDEISATSMPPRDDLAAPLVGGKDYVMERIRMALFVAQQRLTASESMMAEAARRERVGAGTGIDRLEAELEVTRARAAMGVLAEQQKLRKEFLELATPGDQLARRLQRQQLMMDAMVADQAMKSARERLELVRRQRAAGAASELDQLRAEVELKEREAELMALARQLRGLAAAP